MDVSPTSTSGCAGGGKIQLPYHPLTDDKLLHLARNGQGKLLDEANIARDLVVGNVTTTEVADLRLVAGFSWNQPDPGADLLAQPGVGDSHHLHIGDLGVRVEKFL